MVGENRVLLGMLRFHLEASRKGHISAFETCLWLELATQACGTHLTQATPFYSTPINSLKDLLSYCQTSVIVTFSNWAQWIQL